MKYLTVKGSCRIIEVETADVGEQDGVILHDSWNAARNHLLDDAWQEVLLIQGRLSELMGNVRAIEFMKEPD